jgi:hypothetical protein
MWEEWEKNGKMIKYARYFFNPDVFIVVRYSTARYLVRASTELLGTRHCGILKRNAAVTRTVPHRVTKCHQLLSYGTLFCVLYAF